MFKCLCLDTGETVIILSSRWRDRLAELRKLDKKDQLVCQGCNQPVRLKTGRRRRWHFAHKHLQNCPFESSSPELISARSILYEWLVKLFGEEATDIEVASPSQDLSRPVDAWVNKGQEGCAFWIIERRMPPEIRGHVKQGLSKLNIPYIFIMLSDMLHPVPDQVGSLYLTTTERECAVTSDLDLIHHPLDKPLGQSLYYLDPLGQTLTTYRDLVCIHKPQIYKGHVRKGPLESVGIDLRRGAFVHEGEENELEKIQVRQGRRREKLDGSRKVFGNILSRMLPDESEFKTKGNDTRIPQVSGEVVNKPTMGISLESRQLFNRVAVCMFCGQSTEDWWYLDRKTGLCKCRECLKKGLGS